MAQLAAHQIYHEANQLSAFPREKNAHFLGEQKVELWLKPLCLQEQFFNRFVWCIKSVPRTQGLLITVGPFPSLQINWQKPLVPSFWMLLLFRAGKWPPPWNAYSFLRDLGIAQPPRQPPAQQTQFTRRPHPLVCLPELAQPAGVFASAEMACSLQSGAACTSPPGGLLTAKCRPECWQGSNCQQ